MRYLSRGANKAWGIARLGVLPLVLALVVVTVAQGQPRVSAQSATVPIDSAATAVDHDDGIYVVGTSGGELYVVDEAGNSTETSLGAATIRDVRIENGYIAVAMATEVIGLSLTGLTPTELWRTTPSNATAVVSIDLSEDGAYVTYLAQRGPDYYTDAGEVGVLAGSDGSLIDSLYASGYRPTNYWLDATGDMEYIAASQPNGGCCNMVGISLYSFDGANLTLDWWTLLTTNYDVAEVRVSENKDYVAGVTSSGTEMDILDLANGSVLGQYDAVAEQFAVDGDDDLRYLIGGTVTAAHRYLVFKNLESGPNYLSLIDDGAMSGGLDSSAQIDSNPDASCVAFGSDGGDYIMLSRTGDTLSTALSGSVTAPIGAVEVGDETLLVANPSAIELYPNCTPTTITPTQTPTITPTQTPTPTPTQTPTQTPCTPPDKKFPRGCAVGGIALDSAVRGLPLDTANSSGSSAGVLATVAGIAAAAFALGGAAWYSRRRAD